MSKGIKLLTLSRIFFFSAISLIANFGVIYFYQIYNESVYIAILPFIIPRILYAVLLPFFAPFISRIGIRKSLIIGTMFTFITGSTIFLLEKYPLYLFYLMINIALSLLFYYLPLTYFMSKYTKSKNRGSELGFLQASIVFTLALTPFIGGLISEIYGIIGFSILLAILLLMSIVPLYSLKNYHFEYTGKLKNYLKVRPYLKMIKMVVLNQAQIEISLFWYIYVFLFFGSFSDFGILISLVTLTGAILSYLFGKYLDQHNRRTIIHWEGLLNSLAWLARFFSFNTVTIFLADAYYKLNRFIKDEAVDVVSFDILNRGKHDELLDEKLIIREMSINLGKAGFLIAALIVFYFLGLKGPFLLAAVISLFFFKF